MKTSFLSISFSGRNKVRSEIDQIRITLKDYGFTTNVFVDEYQFDCDEEEKMMLYSCRDIERADIVLAEVSEKAIGVGIEVGYAIAIGKPVIYLRNSTAEYSKTIGGLVKNQVTYSSTDELDYKLRIVLQNLQHKASCSSSSKESIRPARAHL